MQSDFIEDTIAPASNTALFIGVKSASWDKNFFKVSYIIGITAEAI